MNFNKKVLTSINEAKYLSQDASARYRAITRVMYRAYEQLKYPLYRNDIFEMLREYDEFKNYDEDQFKRDLDQLVAWNNLIDQADTARVSTPKEFLDKILIYRLSPYTIEFERMLITLENTDTGLMQKSSLDSFFVEEFKETLFKINQVLTMNENDIYHWWVELNDHFKKLSENYNDYINSFYSPNTDDLLKTKEFIIFKENFIKYLKSFIKGMQLNAHQIKIFMSTEVDQEKINFIVSKVAEHKEKIPTPGIIFDKQEFIAQNLGTYETMQHWFLPHKSRKALSEEIIDHTNAIIRKITRFAIQLMEQRNSSVNRKNEYSKLLQMFYNCNDVDEAHKLSAILFGACGTRHIFVKDNRETDSIHSSLYDEAPTEIILKPRVNTYREKMPKTPILENPEDLRKRKEERLKKRNEQEELMRKLIVDNKIVLKELPIITVQQRQTLLSWLSKKNLNNDKGSFSGQNEFGMKYKCSKPDTTNLVKIECEDGVFYSPNFIIEFY